MVLPVGGRKPGIPDRTDFELNTDVSALNTFKDRFYPGAAMEPGKSMSWDEDGDPFIRDDKVYSPDQFGGAGDGTTNDGPALEKMVTAINNAGGGRISLLGRTWRCDRTLEFDAPVVIDGAQIGSWNTTTLPLLGVLRFDAGITGIRLTHNAQMCTIKRLGINSQTRFEEGPYEGHGLHIRGKRWRLEQVFVRGFGEHGIFIEGNALVDSSNANIGNATLTRSVLNHLDGWYLHRTDANVITLVTCDGSSNGRYGFNNEGLLKNTFINCHAAFNGEGDYRDRATGGMYLNCYSEQKGKFIIDNGSQGGTIITGGDVAGLSTPELWFGTEGSYTNTPSNDPLYSRDWYVMDQNWLRSPVRLQGNQSGNQYSLAVDRTANAQLAMFDVTNSERVFVVAPGAPPTWRFECPVSMIDGNDIATGTTTGTKIATSSTQKLGFFGATPITRPVANPDTSGATLEQLEAEVNELKATLRSLGLMAS